MSDNKAIYEFVGDKFGISQDTMEKLKGFIEKGKTIVEWFGKVSAAVNAVEGLLEQFGIFQGEKSELDKLYDKIAAALKDIKNQINLASKLDTEQSVDDLKGNADGVFVAVNNYLNLIKELGNPPSSNALEVKELEQNISISTHTLTDLMKSAFWHKVFDENAVCQLVWGRKKYITPKESDGHVWDYRLTLPTLLYAISARLMLLKTLEPAFRSIHNDEINTYADYLHSVYQKITSGIVRTPAPPVHRIMDEKVTGTMHINAMSHIDTNSFTDWWTPWKKSCGAVEIYSAASQIEVLPFEQPISIFYFENFGDYEEGLQVSGGNNLTEEKKMKQFQAQLNAGIEANQKLEASHNWFYLVFAIRAERAWQTVFELVGLSELWQTIRELKQLIGESFPPFPPEQGYSIKAVLQSNVQISFEPFSFKAEQPLKLNIGQPISLRHFAKILGPALSLTDMSGLLAPLPPISLRRMLAGS